MNPMELMQQMQGAGGNPMVEAMQEASTIAEKIKNIETYEAQQAQSLRDIRNDMRRLVELFEQFSNKSPMSILTGR